MSTANKVPSDWLDLKQAEQIYPLSRRVLWKWISAGRLPVYKPFNRKVLLKRSDIDRLLESTRVEIDHDHIMGEVIKE